jgi:hypothetical protein
VINPQTDHATLPPTGITKSDPIIIDALQMLVEEKVLLMRKAFTNEAAEMIRDVRYIQGLISCCKSEMPARWSTDDSRFIVEALQFMIATKTAKKKAAFPDDREVLINDIRFLDAISSQHETLQQAQRRISCS